MIPPMSKLNKAVRYVIIDHMKKTIKAEKNADWSALQEDRSLSAWIEGTLTRCVRGTLSIDEGMRTSGP